MTNPDENQLKNSRQRLTPIHRWTKMRACLSRAAWAAMFFGTRVRTALAARKNDAEIAYHHGHQRRSRQTSRPHLREEGRSAGEFISESDHRQNKLRIPWIPLQL